MSRVILTTIRDDNVTQIKEDLFNAFREDHAALGRMLYDLRTKVTANDITAAQALAKRLDQEAGAHIAFEEADFYPALRPFLSDQEVDEMYKEHAEGLAMVQHILDLDGSDKLDQRNRNLLIKKIEALETHVSDCGELFGAMGGLSPARLQELWERLNYWREKAPRWAEIGEKVLTPGL